MRSLKKWVVGILTVCMSVMMLAGCGSDTETKSASNSDNPSDVQEIIDRGTLKVGVKNVTKGFGYEDPATGEYSGLEISLAKKLAESLGVEVEFTPVTAATRTALLDSGDIDCVIATFTITDERKNSWDFTTPYYTDHVGVLVENSSGIKNLADLKIKQLAYLLVLHLLNL